nr:MAG TPA: Replicase polyprotein 1ab, FCoV, nsp4, VIRAL PROTEIN [Caudoviricetes sp.]
MGDVLTSHGGRFDDTMGDKKTSHGGQNVLTCPPTCAILFLD